MEVNLEFQFLLYLAVILITTKFFGIVFRKLGMPQVVGMLVAGIIIGPAVLNIVPADNVVIKAVAQIGVILLMFSAGLETNIKEIRTTGLASVVITTLGVIVPFVGGFLLSWAFQGFEAITSKNYIEFLFFGVLLTATSVGITVEALKEMGKIKGKVGTSILAAAVLDDIIGIIVLAIVIGLKTGETSIGQLFLNMALFFIGAIVVGIAIHYFFKWMFKHFPITRRLPIFGLAVCFLFAWAAEMMGIADITGAFIAGMVLSNMKQTSYIERKIDINSYMLFSPVFFASIGIEMSFTGFTMKMFWFSVALVVVGIITKIVGCGLGARICGYSNKESLRVGYGMVARGEVGLIVAQRGIADNIISAAYMPAAIMLVIITSLITPILLKSSYSKEKRRLLVDVSEGEEPPAYTDDSAVNSIEADGDESVPQ